ncbi:N-sulfoglucosamine sulfohydrolase [Fusobacterium ulcerans]|jgi:N-sulfoglucosamine sulfohydrolase|uniref:sulfatase family protein n=1 Tax=Fusobacterium ulcerans TaxID=861 RepID=UPI000E4DA238|nr:sulfatase [Fusobacterium ulcerans]RGY65698.1 N-sulfoglucosamine sulfohydrolase [Fusobacterium ulcerans]
MNVIYINTHDSGRMLSPYGYDIPTENLKKLAEDSVVFTNAFCAGPTCSPSRAALLTGIFPHQNGMLGLAQRGFSLYNPEKHLANFLRNNGYNTCLCGIQHEYGWYLDLEKNGLHNLGYNEILTTDSKSFKKEELHLWDRNNAVEVVKWLDNYENDKPFLLSFGMHSTHRPYPVEVADFIDERYVVPPYPITNNEENRHDHAQYMTTAHYADENIKMIVDALKRNNLYENSIIIFTTDHGLAVPFNKCNLTDTGIGVSLIMKVPEAASNGKIVDSLVSQIDVFPTLCELLNLDKPEYLEGKSFAEAFADNKAVLDEYIFAEVNFHTSYEPIRCVRTKRYKYIKYYDETWNKVNLSNMDESVPKDFLMENGLKEKIKYKEGLFDLYYDPTERNNLADDSKYKEVLEKLREVLHEKQVKTDDPILKGALEIKKGYKVNKVECETASSKNKDDYVSYN